MKKIQNLIAGMLLIVCLMPFSGCRKLIDAIFPGNTHNHYSACKIKHITSQVSSAAEDEVIATVEYNAANNPVSLLYNKEMAYALYLRYFSYDSLNRLIEYKVMYDTSLEIETHRYGYSGNRITSDTATNKLTGYMVILSTFEYDSGGRIIVEHRKIIDFEGSPDTWEEFDPINYRYVNNNLGAGEKYVYDDKVNFRRTNDVWMFILRNYSQNNLVGATEYNKYGLPVRFKNSTDVLFYTQLTSIEYDCE